MRTYIAIGLLLIVAASAQAQTMGDLNAAQGVHHSLAGRGVNRQTNTVSQVRDSLERSNARHNNWEDPEGTDDGEKSDRSRPDRAR
jgi:hypothetical protein